MTAASSSSKPFAVSSMTGFGMARGVLMGVAGTDDNTAPELEVSIRTVNHRYFKSTIRLPDLLLPFEREVEQELRAGLRRGAIVCAIRVHSGSAEGAPQLDVARARELARQLLQLAAELTLHPPDLATIATLPGVVTTSGAADLDDDVARESLVALVKSAVESNQQMRRVEGVALAEDMAARLKLVADWSREVGERSPQVTAEYRQKLHERINELLKDGPGRVTEADLAREVAMFADRADITEEVTRMLHHVSQFEAALRKSSEVGRQLDFMAQEMLREANTMGSKCNDAAISSMVIAMKAEIEKIKEQVQNIE
ncbi:MAG: YicC/YloC family endoribonuclease [Planctomycetota bacterium]